MSRPTTLITIVSALLLVSTAHAQLAYDGRDFQANTFTKAGQYPNVARSVSRSSDGSFVIVWESLFQDGSTTSIFGQRYDSAGNPIGAEFQVNTYTTESQRNAAVASAADGSFIVVWDEAPSSGNHDGDASGVFGQRFDGSGLVVGSEFQINTYTTGHQLHPSVAAAADGSFVAVWSSSSVNVGEPPQNGDGAGIFGQRFDAAGTPSGPEFRVNTNTSGSQRGAAVASAADGRFVVAWGSDTAASGDVDVVAQRFDVAGTPSGTEFRMNSYTAGTQSQPSLSMDDDGSFVAVWRSGGFGNSGPGHPDGDGFGVFGQRFDGSGLVVGSEFQVNTYTTGTQWWPAVSSHGDGRFVVVWENEEGQDGGNSGVFGQRFDSSGSPVGSEFLVNTYVDGNQSDASVSAHTDSSFVVVWDSGGGQDGSAHGTFGQLFCDDATPGCTPVDFCNGAEGGMLAKVTLKKTNVGVLADFNRFKIRGKFVLPNDSSFSMIAPTTKPVGLIIESFAGLVRVDETIPQSVPPPTSGDGWSENRGHTIWRFKDKSGSPVNGITKVFLKDLNKKAPGRVQVRVTGKGGVYPIVAGDEPIRVTLELEPRIGICGDATLAPDQCMFSRSGASLRCR